MGRSVEDSRFRSKVHDLGFMIYDLWLMVFRYRVLRRVQGFRFRVSGARFRV